MFIDFGGRVNASVALEWAKANSEETLRESVERQRFVAAEMVHAFNVTHGPLSIALVASAFLPGAFGFDRLWGILPFALSVLLLGTRVRRLQGAYDAIATALHAAELKRSGI